MPNQILYIALRMIHAALHATTCMPNCRLQASVQLWYAISAKSRILAPLDHRWCNVALLVACTGTPTVPTALAVPYDYAPAVARVLGPTIAMSVTILKL